MKQLFILLTISVFLTGASNIVLAQDPGETEIRRLETLERESVLKGDSAVLFDKIWSPYMIVNTPANVVGTVEGTKAHLRWGDLNYFEDKLMQKVRYLDKLIDELVKGKTMEKILRK